MDVGTRNHLAEHFDHPTAQLIRRDEELLRHQLRSRGCDRRVVVADADAPDSRDHRHHPSHGRSLVRHIERRPARAPRVLRLAAGARGRRHIAAVPHLQRSGVAGMGRRSGRQSTLRRPARSGTYIAAEPFAPASARVTRMRETANSTMIDVVSTGRAFLVASVTGHRYWSATIDGNPAPLIATNIAYQGLIVPAGTHTIAMQYRNPLVPIGAAITLLTLIALAIAAFHMRTSAYSADKASSADYADKRR